MTLTLFSWIHHLKVVYLNFRQWFCYSATHVRYIFITEKLVVYVLFNPLRSRQIGQHFADDIFKCIFVNEGLWVLINISLKFVPKVQINNIPALVQIMAWCRPSDKPLTEPMMKTLLTQVCVTRSQCVNIVFVAGFSYAKKFILNHWYYKSICALWTVTIFWDRVGKHVIPPVITWDSLKVIHFIDDLVPDFGNTSAYAM